MDATLESLIDKIRKDGVAKAKSEAQEIINNAKSKAQEIIDKAKDESERIIAKAGGESKKLEKNAQAAIRQAARDTVLMVKEELVKIFDRVIKNEVRKSLNPEFTAQLITKMVDKWSLAKEEQLEVLAAKEDVEKIKNTLLAKIKEEAKGKLVINVASSINKGFRIGIKGEEVYYDFSEEAIVEVFKELINPQIKEILDSDG